LPSGADLDRRRWLADPLEDLITIVGRLKRLNVGFLSLHEKLDTTTPGGMFVFHFFAALAECLRTINRGTHQRGPGRRP
jgi:DNA invertase Pin-like site-specific DNA recombinase